MVIVVSLLSFSQPQFFLKTNSEMRYDKFNMKNEIIISITDKELMLMQSIKIDNDKSETLAFIKILLSRIEIKGNKGMKSHLDN